MDNIAAQPTFTIAGITDIPLLNYSNTDAVIATSNFVKVTTSVASSQELINSLNTLNELYENGLLSDEELVLAKRKILQ